MQCGAPARKSAEPGCAEGDGGRERAALAALAAGRWHLAAGQGSGPAGAAAVQQRGGGGGAGAGPAVHLLRAGAGLGEGARRRRFAGGRPSGADAGDARQIRKKFGIWPLDLQVGFDLDPREVRIRNWVCSCREKLLGGDIGLDLNRQEVAYSKTLEMQGGSRLAITASVNYDSLLLGRLPGDRPFAPAGARSLTEPRSRAGGHPRPTVGVNLLSNLPGLDGLQRSTLTQENQFDLQTEVPITRNVHVELCANATVPLPAARYSMSEAGAELRVGDGDWHLHLSEVNAVYRF